MGPSPTFPGTMPSFGSFVPAASDLPLEQLIERLQSRSTVLGVVLLGSTATGLGEASDLDLLLVLAGGLPFDVEFSWVDGRPTDVVLVSRSFVQRVAESASPSGEASDVARWIAAGRVEWTRDPEIAALLANASHRADSAGPKRGEQFTRWVEANFLLTKLRRYAAADAPDYEQALELALLPAIYACVLDHLCFRDQPWQGEKAALAWLGREDPEFLVALREALRASTTDNRMRAYARLVERACEPVGGVWPAGRTAGGWRLPSGEDPPEGRFEALVRGRPGAGPPG